MQTVTEARLVRNFLEECGRIDSIYLDDAVSYPFNANRRRNEATPNRSMFVREGRLMYSDESSELELGRYCGQRRLAEQNGGIIVLNGDGLDDRLTRVQTRLRERAQRMFGVRKVAVIPFLALFGAGIDIDTILPIQILGDRWEQRRLRLSVDPRKLSGARNRHHERDTAWNRPKNGVDIGDGEGFTHYAEHDRWSGRWNHVYEMNRIVPGGPKQWRQVRFDKDGAYLPYQAHHLGSSVFTANGPDGKNHSYISSFDENENRPLYYLAQLPDGREIKTYREAVESLAPPIVRQAQKEGRVVHRQGDVFAIETDIADKDMRQMATIHSRSSVFENGKVREPLPMSTAEERKGIMIYGTAHTATKVARKENGVTFVSGTMYHDPVLEDDSRTREHASMKMSAKWYLAVRNTVPRSVT